MTIYFRITIWHSLKIKKTLTITMHSLLSLWAASMETLNGGSMIIGNSKLLESVAILVTLKDSKVLVVSAGLPSLLIMPIICRLELLCISQILTIMKAWNIIRRIKRHQRNPTDSSSQSFLFSMMTLRMGGCCQEQSFTCPDPLLEWYPYHQCRYIFCLYFAYFSKKLEPDYSD